MHERSNKRIWLNSLEYAINHAFINEYHQIYVYPVNYIWICLFLLEGYNQSIYTNQSLLETNHYISQSCLIGAIVERLLPSLIALLISSLFCFMHWFNASICWPQPIGPGWLIQLTTRHPNGLHKFLAI